MTDYDFLLQDRIAKIQAINEQYDLEHNAYISFSGGKDSTILHYLIDMALPNNKIPRLFLNTGVEYKDIRLFVKSLAEQDERFIIKNSNVNIKQMLIKNGYPFKSKQHAHNWLIYDNNRDEINPIIDFLEQNPDKQFDYDYIHNLSRGTKSIIKYVFGVREKDTPINVVRERERERSVYQYKDCP